MNIHHGGLLGPGSKKEGGAEVPWLVNYVPCCVSEN